MHPSAFSEFLSALIVNVIAAVGAGRCQLGGWRACNILRGRTFQLPVCKRVKNMIDVPALE